MSEQDKKIKKLREDGLTKEAIAKRLGISPSTVARAIKRMGLPEVQGGARPVDGKHKRPKKNGDGK